LKYYDKNDNFSNPENFLVKPSDTPLTIKPLTAVRLRKPDPLWWVRAHPSPEFRGGPYALVGGAEGERESYIVASSMVSKIPGVLKLVEISAAISRGGTLFLWRVPIIANMKDRENVYNDTHRKAYELAKGQWVRVYIEQEAYRVELEVVPSPDPIWPELTFGHMLSLAFGDRLIKDENSPRYKELKGLQL
jgi:hypothetical protein